MEGKLERKLNASNQNAQESVETQLHKYDQTEHLAHFNRMVTLVIKNLKKSTFSEGYDPNALNLPRLFSFGMNKASLSSQEIHSVATDFYRFCKSNTKIVFNQGETVFEKNMKNEYVDILNSFKELFTAVGTRVISGKEYNPSAEIILSYSEREKLKSICSMMNALNIKTSFNEEQAFSHKPSSQTK